MTEKLLSYENRRIVNAAFVMESLLLGRGMFVKSSGSCQCPFHDDGRCSAKIYEDDNSIFCWVCQKKYEPYDVLHELMGVKNQQIIMTVKKAGKWTEPPRQSKKKYNLFSDKGKADALCNQFKKGKLPVEEYSDQLRSLCV